MKKIVIDCLGADRGQEEIAFGAILAKDLPLNFVLVGEREKLEPLLRNEGVDLSRYEIIDAKRTVNNGEDPRVVIRGGEDTSVVKGLDKAKEDDVIGYISAGNTGAVLIGSIFRVGLLPGIKFPALGCNLINIHGKYFCLLDCGANLDLVPEQMVKFARIGLGVASSYYGIPSPRIGLLNVGREEGKGNALAKESYKALKESGLNFVGNIEGSDIIMDKADVIVCDGFSGNVALKSLESAAMFCRSLALEGGNKELSDKIHTYFGYTDLGASIVYGCKKIVMKPHGSSSKKTIAACIKIALEMDEKDMVGALGKALGE
ncbi:MAG: phosphate--acyl-ACP acyltransferase [Bacilli bacterium]|nr:phosphate--acyl-ACP acyltransferase [Bacilli bacterium]